MKSSIRCTATAFRAAHLMGALKVDAMAAYAWKQRAADDNGTAVDTTPGSPAWRPLA